MYVQLEFQQPVATVKPSPLTYSFRYIYPSHHDFFSAVIVGCFTRVCQCYILLCRISCGFLPTSILRVYLNHFHFCFTQSVSFSVSTAILRCVFRTGVLCGVCFWLIASLFSFILLDSNCGWQKNMPENSSVAVRGWKVQ